MFIGLRFFTSSYVYLIILFPFVNQMLQVFQVGRYTIFFPILCLSQSTFLKARKQFFISEHLVNISVSRQCGNNFHWINLTK